MRKHYLLMNQAGEGGEGGGGASTFDPAAFEAKIFTALDGKLNGFAKNLRGEITKLISKPQGEGQGDGEGQGEGTPPKADPKANPEAARLQRQLDKLTQDLNQEKEARVKTEASAKETTRKTAISEALNGFQYANDKARLAAQRLFDAEVRYNEAGELVAGPDEMPVAEFIKTQMREHEYLLAPKTTGGSGMQPGKQGGAKVYTLDDIKTGMKPEEQAAVAAQILSVSGLK